MKFRLLRGLHQGRDPQTGQEVVYDAKDPDRCIVESDTNLELQFGHEKFQSIDRILENPDAAALKRRVEELEAENQRLRETTGIAPEPKETLPDLTAMSTQDLRAYAKGRGIDLEPGLKKDEIINLIQYELQTA